MSRRPRQLPPALPSRLILERMYAVPARLPARRRWFNRVLTVVRFRRKLARWVERRTWRLVFVSVGVGVWAVGHVYYYNRLIDLEYNVQAAWAQVEASQQKRNHISRNLTQLLRYYSGYEGNLMKDVTKIREDGHSQKPPKPLPKPASGDSPEVLLGRLFAIAEAYPDLKLTNTAEKFSDAVIASETEIAQQIMGYNDNVNMYTTALSQFPGNLFGRVLGFQPYKFYEPEARDVLEFKELKL